jgi:hypothetical protein
VVPPEDLVNDVGVKLGDQRPGVFVSPPDKSILNPAVPNYLPKAPVHFNRHVLVLIEQVARCHVIAYVSTYLRLFVSGSANSPNFCLKVYSLENSTNDGMSCVLSSSSLACVSTSVSKGKIFLLIQFMIPSFVRSPLKSILSPFLKNKIVGKAITLCITSAFLSVSPFTFPSFTS